MRQIDSNLQMLTHLRSLKQIHLCLLMQTGSSSLKQIGWNLQMLTHLRWLMPID